MRFDRMRVETVQDINNIEIYIKNGELEEAKKIISSLEETVLKDPKNKNLKKTIIFYKNQIKQKEKEYV